MFEGVDAIPEDCHTAAYSSDDLIRCPHILSLANNKKILDIVELYLGVKPTLALITSWWSVPGRREAKESQLFHRDMDDLRFIKFFIYLTDVNGSDDAAHVYVKESHNLNILTKAGRYSDSEVEKAFDKNNIIQITGKAGEGFLEDTFGIHKGNVSKSSKRLILQFQYSLHPIGTYDYNPLNISGDGYDSYINRLYKAENSMTNIAFVVSYKKTILFYEVAKKLGKQDISCFWISPNSEWKKWLIKQGVGSRFIINIAELWEKYRRKEKSNDIFPTLDKLEEISGNRINNIILSDRNLSKKSVFYGKNYLELVAKTVTEFLACHQISHVFSEITWGVEQVIDMVCRANGICCVQPHAIRIPSGRFAFFKGLLNNDIYEVVKDDSTCFNAKQFLKFFRESRPQPKYLKLNNKIPRLKLKMIFSLFRHLFISADETKWTVSTLIKDRFRTALNAKLIKFINFEKKPDLNKRYIFVTLHKQPEATVDIWGECYSNQYENIEKISRSVKNNTLVYVKEHSNAIGDRSIFWYKKIARLPNVVLINPYLNSFDLMAKAKAVVSVSGTVCYEAALMGVPAFTFGDMFFGDILAGNNINYDDLKKVFDFNSGNNPVKNDKELCDFINYVVANSFEGIISDPDSDPDCISEINIQHVTNGFLTLLKSDS